MRKSAGFASPAAPRAGQLSAGEPPDLPRLLPGRTAVPVELLTHQRLHGAVPYRGGQRRLIPEVEAAGLTDRAGGEFPVHRALAAMASAASVPAVIGTGAEGEPSSRKDNSLLWISPHLVLDGLQLAAEAAGSPAARLHVQGSPRLLGRLAAAMADRQAAGTDQVAVELAAVPPGFPAGDAPAPAGIATGVAALPRSRRPAVSGGSAGGRAALVQNVETLAHLALIARYGAAWFRTAGTGAEPGSMLATLYQASGRVDVVETVPGTPLRDLIALGGRAAGGDAAEVVSAVLAGGYHGVWLTVEEAACLPYSNAGLRRAGAGIGPGVLAALPAGRCGLAETARMVRYLATEPGPRCGSCRRGLPRLAAGLAALADPRRRPSARAHPGRWAGWVTGRADCQHADGAVRLATSALRVFGAEISLHTRGECTGTSGRPFLAIPVAGRGEMGLR